MAEREDGGIQAGKPATERLMVMKSDHELAHAVLLGEVMRTIRRERRMRTSEVASALKMPTRTYEHLEAGRGRMSFDRIERFARATNSDPAAIVAAVMLGAPAFALSCIDNKLMEVVVHALGELNEELGADISFLETRTIVAALRKTCQDLADHVRRRDTFAETWLKDRVEKTRPTALARRGRPVRQG